MQISIGNINSKQMEIVERKGIGHPDTICDEISEAISVALCKLYLEEFGLIMHHNVDKALLVGGQSNPTYEGGTITNPMHFIIAGRATNEVGAQKIPVEDLAIQTTHDWFKEHMRYLDPKNHLQIDCKIRPGSSDLVQLFHRIEKSDSPLANDTSFGAGYYPLSPLDKKVLQVDQLLNSPTTRKQLPFVGEDTKVMGYRHKDRFQFTIAIAMVDRFIENIQDYQAKIRRIKQYISDNLKIEASNIIINCADDYLKESIYLTVTGTSAESGDDGQVGRGNRINGLITPYQPMSLEATAGKNPVSHVGKIYNYFALDVCKRLIMENFASEAQLFIVSQIGKPITQPLGLHVRMKNQLVPNKKVRELVHEMLPDIGKYWVKILAKDRHLPQQKEP